MNDYPYIRKWGELMGSYKSYTEDMVELARKTNAPSNAIFRKYDSSGATNEWATTDDVTRPATRAFLGLDVHAEAN